jgi:succinate-semialdehyde dehydrogenase/glutarate-semialdehyde dehydrogenase
VAEPIADEFTRLFVEGMRALRVGDPMDPATDIGPLATPGIVDDLEKQVSDSVARGARILAGGKRIAGRGNWFEPTVITDVPRGSPAWREEMFGPVATLYRVPDIDAAIALANDTTFGLGASVWTRHDGEALRFAEEIEAGQVFVNAMVASDPRFPFGGVKRSGFGRELSAYGLREFVNIKTVRNGAPQGKQTETE